MLLRIKRRLLSSGCNSCLSIAARDNPAQGEEDKRTNSKCGDRQRNKFARNRDDDARRCGETGEGGINTADISLLGRAATRLVQSNISPVFLAPVPAW